MRRRNGDAKHALRGTVEERPDGFTSEQGRTAQEYLQRYTAEIQIEWLPGYAPDLNPAEQIWNHGKYSDLANFSLADCAQLELHVEFSMRKQGVQSSLLRSFFKTADLPL